MRLPKHKWPRYLDEFKRSGVLKGIYIGECPDGDMTDVAHAHSWTEYGDYGIVCFAHRRFFVKPVVLHEVAHLLAPNQHHTDEFRRALSIIGGELGSFTAGGVEIYSTFSVGKIGKNGSTPMDRFYEWRVRWERDGQ